MIKKAKTAMHVLMFGDTKDGSTGEAKATDDSARLGRFPSVPWLLAGFVSLGLYALVLYAYFDVRRPLWVGAASMALFAIAGAASVAAARGKVYGETPYICALFLSGLLMMAVFTPGTVPDENYHFNSAYKWSDMLMGFQVDDDSIAMRLDDVMFEQNVMVNYTLDRHAYDAVLSQRGPLVEDGSVVQFDVPSSYSVTANVPQLRLPAALGITLARLLGLGSAPLFYLGRLCNFAFFAALVIAAVRLTPVGANVMKVASLLPMTLHVAASYSYDAGTIGLAFLFTALLLRSVCGKGIMSRRDIAALVTAAFVLAPCKSIYVLLIFGVLLIPGSRFASRRQAVLFRLGILAVALGAVLLMRLPTLLSWSGAVAAEGDGLSYRGEEAGHFYTVSGLLADPIRSALLVARTLFVMASNYLLTLMGASLGWFQSNLQASTFFACLLCGVMVASFMAAPDDRRVLSGLQRTWLLVISVAIFLALIITFAVSWTFDTEPIVSGVQGRYFLPFLPLLGIGLRGNSVRAHIPLGDRLSFLLLFIDLAYLLRIATFAVA